MIRSLFVAFALLLPTTVRAEWHEASSTNFIVYSQGEAEAARDFAVKLESFNYVLRTFHNLQAAPARGKLRVFLLPNLEAVGRMVGGSGLAGYYIPDSRGLMMVGTRRTYSRSNDIRSGRLEVEIDPESILLHEYAHHFMFQYFPATYPAWYREGFAEFWGATRFGPNNLVEVGHPVDYRYESLTFNRWTPIAQLLGAQSYEDMGEFDLIYAQGWLMVRYTFESRERRQQLQRYLALINEGLPYSDAAAQAFGNLQQLNSELYDYSGRRRFDVLQLPFRNFPIGEVSVRALRPAEEALLEYEIQLSQGTVSARDLSEFASDLRSAASRYPDDPFALGLLTEVERLAGNLEAARSAADRWARFAPDQGRPIMYQGVLQIELLRRAASTDRAAWTAARRLLVRANQLTPNDPLILEAYYDSFVAQNIAPPETAQNALYTAMDLAPSDDDLRYKVARDFEHRNMIEDAIAIIRPAAYRLPHNREETEGERRRREAREDRERTAGESRRETARQMLTRLEAQTPRNQPAASASPSSRQHPQ